jgi:hypothetical protein
MYERLDQLDVDDESDRVIYISTLATILVYEADSMIVIHPDHRQKIEVLIEGFSEALLGLFKTYLVMNPQIHPDLIVKEFLGEFSEKLKDWYPSSSEFPLDTTLN